ncbi:Plasmodesmata-located protein 7 [Ranunculus cassubicifolius]
MSHLLAFLLLFLSCLPTPSQSATNSFIFGGCSQQKYTPGSAFESNLNSLLTSLVNSATFSSYNNFTMLGSTSQDIVYGLYQCRGDLSMPDCAMCVAHSVTQIGSICPDSTGGALQLQGCFMKYDNTKFLGVEDKSVLLKKCGPSIGYDEELMGRRDAVLTGLGSGGGPYRVGGSGKVQGVAQCVGDLSGSECQDCVSNSIQQLKSECGAAVSGDVFLGKCYARYSAGSIGGYGDSKSHSGSSSNDGERAFAITIGLLAGVALVIVFLSFIRKVVSGKGGK